MAESTFWNRIKEVLSRLLDLLVDSVFLFLWAVINLLLLHVLSLLHQSGMIVVVRWLAQGIFAFFTLAIIALHVIHNLKESDHSGFKAVWEKLLDLTNHLLSLTVNSTMLIGWALINWVVHHLFKLLPGESHAIVFSENLGQFFFGILTLWNHVTKPMIRELVIIYRRLFP
jgi:hypothetical protein